jgi:glycosyltransferase involved in cell wall biosynthesis
MKANKNILILTPFFSPNIGGVETHLDDLVTELNANGITSIVSTYSPLTTKTPYKRYEVRGLSRIYRMGWFGHNWFHKIETNPALTIAYLLPGLLIQSIVLLWKNPTVTTIHAQGFTAALIAKICRVFFGKKLVMSTHALYSLPHNPLLGRVFVWVLAGFDAILTLSDLSAAELERAGVPHGRIKRYAYWVDQDVFRKGNRKTIRDKNSWRNVTVLLFVSRLIKIKGTDVIIDIAERLKNEPKYLVVVIGTGPEEYKISEYAKTNSRLVFLGKMSNSAIIPYYQGADFLILPSVYPEGMARVVLEAGSCGLPVITSNLGCLPEIVTNDRNGFLVSPNAAAIIKKLNNLDQKKLSNMRQTALLHARKNFTKANAKAILEEYA